jgi:hypothetical protein
MRIYYLEEPLGDKDVAFVGECFQLSRPPTQVRIPYVLPVIETAADYVQQRQQQERLLSNHLRAAGVHLEPEQIVLVAPKDQHWCMALVGSVAFVSGKYPYLVQTAAHREAIGNPGATRVIDTQGLMGGRE